MKLECNTVKKCLLSISQVKWYQTINDKAKRYNFPQKLLKLESKRQSNINKYILTNISGFIRFSYGGNCLFQGSVKENSDFFPEFWFGKR